jgi:hypothetical protein
MTAVQLGRLLNRASAFDRSQLRLRHYKKVLVSPSAGSFIGRSSQDSEICAQLGSLRMP